MCSSNLLNFKRSGLAFENYAPNYLCDYAYTLASLFTAPFTTSITSCANNPDRQASWLGLAQIVSHPGTGIRPVEH